jgi:hypothetical protein
MGIYFEGWPKAEADAREALAVSVNPGRDSRRAGMDFWTRRTGRGLRAEQHR